MKKKLKSTFKHISVQKFFAPFMLVVGLIFGFLADRVSGIFFGSNAAEAEQADAQLKVTPYKLLDPYQAAPAKPVMAKVVKAKAKMKACPPAKKHLAKAKPAKKKLQKLARK